MRLGHGRLILNSDLSVGGDRLRFLDWPVQIARSKTAILASKKAPEANAEAIS
jgi:hypothetical protein